MIDYKNYQVPFNWKRNWKKVLEAIAIAASVAYIGYNVSKCVPGKLEVKEGCGGIVIEHPNFKQIFAANKSVYGDWMDNTQSYDTIKLNGEEIQDPNQLEHLVKELEQVRTCNTAK